MINEYFSASGNEIFERFESIEDVKPVPDSGEGFVITNVLASAHQNAINTLLLCYYWF